MGIILEISFDQEPEYFFPGQTIQGTVALHNDSEVKVKGLVLTFFGDIEVYWTESKPTTDTMPPHRSPSVSGGSQHFRRHIHKEFNNHETILCDEIVLLGQGEAEGGNEFILSQGTTVYPFQYKLPVMGLTSTFTECPYGSVRYTADARLKRPLFRYDKADKEFIVKEVIDISSLPKTMQPFGTTERIDFGWICCPEGYFTFDVQLPKTGYIPNETINFTIGFTNYSRVPITNIYATLTQVIEFRTFEKVKSFTSDLRYTTFQQGVEPLGMANWTGNLVIPSGVQPSTLSGNRIISFYYYLKVTAKTWSTKCPVFIGSDTCDVLLAFALRSTSSVSLAEDSPGIHDEMSTTGSTRNTNYNKSATERRHYDPALNPFLNSECDEHNERQLNQNADSENMSLPAQV